MIIWLNGLLLSDCYFIDDSLWCIKVPYTIGVKYAGIPVPPRWILLAGVTDDSVDHWPLSLSLSPHGGVNKILDECTQ